MILLSSQPDGRVKRLKREHVQEFRVKGCPDAIFEMSE